MNILPHENFLLYRYSYNFTITILVLYYSYRISSSCKHDTISLCIDDVQQGVDVLYFHLIAVGEHMHHYSYGDNIMLGTLGRICMDGGQYAYIHRRDREQQARMMLLPIRTGQINLTLIVTDLSVGVPLRILCCVISVYSCYS